MDISGLKRDASKVAAGQWIDDIPNMGDLRLNVRGLSCPQARTLRDRLERKVSRENRDRDGTILPAIRDKIISQVLHEICLLDWDNIFDGDSKIPYSKEQAGEWLNNPDFSGFSDAVAWAAMVVDRGARDVQAELEKNLQAQSDGSSNGESGPAG